MDTDSVRATSSKAQLTTGLYNKNTRAAKIKALGSQPNTGLWWNLNDKLQVRPITPPPTGSSL